MNIKTVLVSLLAPLSIAQAAVINHDAVAAFAQPSPTTTLEKIAITYKPQLYIANGCHPYPAVDADGNTSGGLKPTGAQDSDCTGSALGTQIYGRATEYNGVYAIMYSWYMPKDSPLSGLGHRHEWENVVVWLDSATASSPSIVAVSPSAHGNYHIYNPPSSSNVNGTSAKVKYESQVVINHSLDITTVSGETQPLILYEQLSEAARQALETTDFGSATVPFKNTTFTANLALAYYD